MRAAAHQEPADWHDVKHCAQIGWAQLRNGELLQRAAAEFDVFVTTDQNLRFQHDLTLLPVTVLELNLRDTRFARISSLQRELLEAVGLYRAFRFLSVGEDGLIERIGPRQ